MLVAGDDKQVQGEVGDKGKGMGRIHPLRGQQRVNIFMKVLIDLPLLLLVQALVANYFYSPSREASEQFFFKFLLLGQKVTDEFITLHDLLAGRSAIHRQFAYTGPDLLLQATDTFHEKFIEIGIDNGQELDAFQ